MTSTVKTIVCLANSTREGEYCVAGKERLDDGQVGNWIRPVSGQNSKELSQEEIQSTSGGELGLLDVIEVPLLSNVGRAHQTENWQIASSLRWEKKGVFPYCDLGGLKDNPDSLWHTGYSSRAGENDRIPTRAAKDLTGSLLLIEVSDLEVDILRPWKEGQKPRCRAKFSYKGQPYNLRVADPVYEDMYDGSEKALAIGSCYVTISMPASSYYGCFYKVVAAIITKP